VEVRIPVDRIFFAQSSIQWIRVCEHLWIKELDETEWFLRLLV
jgi:hypothetical protein